MARAYGWNARLMVGMPGFCLALKQHTDSASKRRL